jgi:hypothetical protein
VAIGPITVESEAMMRSFNFEPVYSIRPLAGMPRRFVSATKSERRTGEGVPVSIFHRGSCCLRLQRSDSMKSLARRRRVHRASTLRCAQWLGQFRTECGMPAYQTSCYSCGHHPFCRRYGSGIVPAEVGKPNAKKPFSQKVQKSGICELDVLKARGQACASALTSLCEIYRKWGTGTL